MVLWTIQDSLHANAAKSIHWGNIRIYALKKTYDSSLVPRLLRAYQTAIIRAHWNEVIKLMIETLTNTPSSPKGEEKYTQKPSPQ